MKKKNYCLKETNTKVIPVDNFTTSTGVKNGVNAKASSRWLKEGKLGVHMEARVVAAQDGVTRTLAYEVTKETVP